MVYTQDTFDIIRPIHNEVNNIHNFLNSLQTQLKNCGIINYTIIVTEDCSSDGSKELLKKYSNDPKFNILNSTERLGYSRSIQSAIKVSKSKYIFF